VEEANPNPADPAAREVQENGKGGSGRRPEARRELALDAVRENTSFARLLRRASLESSGFAGLESTGPCLLVGLTASPARPGVLFWTRRAWDPLVSVT
jgi:hypothetical protein